MVRMARGSCQVLLLYFLISGGFLVCEGIAVGSVRESLLA